MTTKVHDAVRTFPNGDGVAAAKGTRVHINSGNVAVSGAADEEIGILEETLLATDTLASVRFLQPGVTVRMIVSEAVAAQADLYRTASGKVGDTAANDRIAIALEAGSGDGSIIECLPAHPVTP